MVSGFMGLAGNTKNSLVSLSMVSTLPVVSMPSSLSIVRSNIWRLSFAIFLLENVVHKCLLWRMCFHIQPSHILFETPCWSSVVYCTYTWMLFTHDKLCIEANRPWVWEREDYMRIRVFHDVQVVESIAWAGIGCQPRSGYASGHIYWPAHWHIFVCQLNTSWAADQVSVVIISSSALG